MNPVRFVVLGIALAMGVGTIWADVRGRHRAATCFKGLTMLLVITVAAWQTSARGVYRALILAGLCASFAGDMLLEARNDRFLHGLAAFLLAHVLYIGAFTVRWPRFGPAWLLLPAAGLFVAVTRMLWSHLGRMRLPVSIYALAILAMAWRAWVLWLGARGLGALAAAMGALLFVISDTALAYNRFVRPLKAAPVMVLLPYFVGQALIGLSV